MGSRRKILLVDDDTSLLVTLGDFLKFEGYEVVTANSGEQALEKLAGFDPDLIVLDMSMPGMGGIGFLRQITASDGKISHPVLVLTARSNMAEFFANVNVDGFIAKPCNPQDLLMEVSRIIFLRRGEEVETQVRPRKRLKVVLGEDDDGVAQRLTVGLVNEGYLVDRVSRGPEVVERSVMERPDVIVVKSVLSGMNGDAVVLLLKEMPQVREIPVVIYDDSHHVGMRERKSKQTAGARVVVGGNDARAIVEALRAVVKD
jgi:DNA-binding response OmpR family regulator